MADTLHPPLQRLERLRVRVRGAVQGVGFRPFVWTLADELELAGWVLNDSDGVLAEVEGPTDALAAFQTRLTDEAPPLARIDELEAQLIERADDDTFEIRTSAKGERARTMVTADMATCDACLEDIFDRQNRRYLYAFTNCTHCGPRYTITHQLPYDRIETSMAPFEMCSTCQGEYEDPSDRRFHAQPNACPTCGPTLSMEPHEIAARLKAGEILAIKGLGGFHLAVDAKNKAAVARLRARKQRDGKPFAVMVAGLASARQLARISDLEAEQLTDRRRPIVICQSSRETGLAPGVSNGLSTIGIMLPYAPIHHLILHALCGAPDGTDWLEQAQDPVIVMTSANPGGEPLVIDNDEATRRLQHIADAIVTHDRDIVVRCDDSVVREIAGAPVYLRRARGVTPDPIQLAHEVPSVIAMGGHLKNTICVTRGREAFLSQHIGDLDNPSTFAFLRETVSHMLSILEVAPERVACDLHPDFLSTRLAEEFGLPLMRVQHHHAHVAAVAAEHGLRGAHLGLALDGFGLGENGADSWGGELLICDDAHFKRVGHFSPLKQPGGDVAARAPWRMGAAAMHKLGLQDQILNQFDAHVGVELVAAMLERDLNAPDTSSAGRLFDAACGLLGVKPIASFEGEAPMALEALVTTPWALEDGWRIDEDGVLDWSDLLSALMRADIVAGANVFHGTLAAGLADWAAQAQVKADLPKQILAAGGCFQNRVLSECLTSELEARGLELVLPKQAPANDGGLSLGQAWIAALAAPETLEVI